KSRIYGLDLQSAWQIDSNWSADGNLSLLNARYVRFFYEDQLNPGLGNQDLKGKPLNRSPDWSLNFGLQYARPLFEGTLTFRADVYSTAQFTLAPANTGADVQPAYTTLGGSISYGTDDGKYLGRIWVKNATNQAYLQGIFALALFGIGREGIYGDPATYGIELTRNL
ncbi:MAG TPA: TonB-dependent receptor, partial [Acidobacteriaceae bacterium]|nr:TonB-dependent receptor [Acidobacteriaceae bacterium]